MLDALGWYREHDAPTAGHEALVRDRQREPHPQGQSGSL
jgi:hypothetical protein